MAPNVNDALLAQLEALERRDADMRGQLLQEGRLFGGYAAEMQQVHRENAQELQRLIAISGWPGKTSVGLHGCRLAWTIAQHAICTPMLQRGFLDAMQEAAQKEDVPWKQVTMLTDRIRFNEGRPQVYGTVFDWNESGELGCELQDPEAIDARRQAVGLPPFAEALEDLRQRSEAEGAEPPDDFHAYRRAFMRWAEEVGWR